MQEILKGIVKGVDLGGWMSQCDYSRERLDTFITEADFAQIARWGFDHVRLPVDYDVIQNADGSLIEEGLRRVDRAVELAGRYGLSLVLDLHKAQGYSFDPGEQESGFFESERCQSYFYAVWEGFARRYGALSERVVFDLLNEITEERYLPAWKRISRECVRRIRQDAPRTRILLGSYWWNSARALPDLDAPYDGRVIYNFHCYEPHAFTHQGAYWMPELKDRTGLRYADCGASEAFFEDFLAPALAKAEREGAALYCGEYGVIDTVPPEEALGWLRDLHAVFERHGIGRCIWSYREMDFGIRDGRWDALRSRLLELI